MSSFLLAQAADPAGLSGLLVANDFRVSPTNYRPDPITARNRPWEDGKLWPRSRVLGSDSTANIMGNDAQFAGRWSEFSEEAGSQSMLKFRGTTLDNTGAALPQCIVQGFVTATETFVGQVSSDNGGYYELPTQYTGTHYLVAYKSGSPDVAGTTLNTLTPS